MKTLMLVLLVFSYFRCTAQNSNNDDSVILLSKNGASKPVGMVLKANKPLKVKTSDGRKLTLVNYSIIGDSLFASSTDTIALKDITSIKGEVKGNAFRKVGGVLLFGAGASLAVMYTFVGIAFSIPEAFLISVPAIGVAYAGRALAETRHFDTTEKWALSITNEE